VEVDDSEEGDKGEISVLNLSHIAHGNHQTIKCQGLIRDVHVQIIVDSGATHNFVSQTLVHKMGWEVEETPDMKIKLGDGFQTKTKGVCRQFEMCIGDFKLTPDLHLF
jgi:hypothetical protein